MYIIDAKINETYYIIYKNDIEYLRINKSNNIKDIINMIGEDNVKVVR